MPEPNTELATDEIKRHQSYILPLEFELVGLLSIVGALQLSLRHPDFAVRPTAVQIRSTIDQIIERVDQDGLHEVAAIMRLGDDPDYDN